MSRAIAIFPLPTRTGRMSAPPMAPESSDASTRLGVARVTISGAGADMRPVLELAARAADGDTAAVAALYEARFDLVFATARRISGRDEHFCLDMVQETFVRVLRSPRALRRVRDEAHVDRWLIAVTHSAVLDALRGERRRAARERAAAAPPQAAPVVDARIEAIARELETLSPEDRELLALRSSGMSLLGIAETIGATVGGVHGRLRRVGRRIAERIGGVE